MCEPRTFAAGEESAPLELAGRRVGLLVGEDLRGPERPDGPDPARELVDLGCDLLLCPSASPYRRGAIGVRHRLAQRAGVDLVHVNAVGATDGLVFDGQSFVLSRDGGPLALLGTHTPADVVFMAHVGFDGLAEVRDLFGGGLVGAQIKAAFWRVPYASIPEERAERAVWLFEQWERVDRWIAAHKGRPT